MKKAILILAVILLGLNFSSCTEQAIEENIQLTEQQECCGNGDILPPPPPED